MASKKEQDTVDVVNAVLKRDDRQVQSYRAHIRELVKADFISVTVIFGDFKLDFVGKRDALSEASSVILKSLRTIIAKNGSYKIADGTKDDDVAYG